MNFEEKHDYIYVFMIPNLTEEAFWEYKALVPKTWVQVLNLLLTSYVIQINSLTSKLQFLSVISTSNVL